MSQFETEWVENSYKNFKIGVIKYAIPLYLACSVYDYLFDPKNFFLGLIIRISIIPLTAISNMQLKKAKSQKSFVKFYLLALVGFSIVQTSLIYCFPNYYQIYFIGLFSLAIGAFSLINLPSAAFYIGNTIVYAPYFTISFFNGFALNETLVFSAYFYTAATIFVISDYLRRLNYDFQLKEFTLRQSLHAVLNEREVTINKLANEISERKLNDELKKHEYRKNEELNLLAQQVAHDIRSPVTALNIAAQKVRTTSTEVSDIITHTCTRINDLADSLLDKFVLKANQPKESESANLQQILTKVIKEKSLMLEKVKKDISFLNDLKSPTPVQINENELTRIISNLIDNSIDAIKHKGEIKITSTETLEALTLKITDSGAGIPPEILPSIGQYGFSYGKERGSGLGLAHAIKIIESQNGTIHITSAPNKLTEVKIVLRKSQSTTTT